MLVKIIPEFSNNNICNYPYLTVTSYGHLCQTQSKSCKSHSASPQALLGFPQPREHQPGWGKEAAAFAQLSFLLEKPTNQPKSTDKQTTKLEKREEGTNKRDPIYHRNIFVNNKIIYIKHIIFSSLQNSLRTRYFARKTVGILNTYLFLASLWGHPCLLHHCLSSQTHRNGQVCLGPHCASVTDPGSAPTPARHFNLH